MEEYGGADHWMFGRIYHSAVGAMRRESVNRLKYLPYVCCIGVVVLLVWIYLDLQYFGTGSLQDQYRLLCDAFTIPGLLMILSGALIWVSNEGALNGISYCLRLAVSALIPGKRKDGYETYSDYVERQGQKKVHGYAFLFWSGLATMTVALIFFVLYSLQ